jgi:adenylylsulfate kinase-like enzyme
MLPRSEQWAEARVSHNNEGAHAALGAAVSKCLTITIAGAVAAGKTTAAIIIEKALRDAGFAVTPMANPEGDADAKRTALREGRLGLAGIQGVPVVIREVQLARNAPQQN